MPALKSTSSDPVWNKALKIVPFGIFIGIGMLIAGIIIINPSDNPCWNSMSTSCSCNVDLEVTNFIEGDIVLSYNLDALFEGKNKTELFLSRDDSQLSGNLNTTVSAACSSPYDYDDNGKPIAPCGALADAMFNDTINDIYPNSGRLPSVTYGLLHDNEKIGFKNPPGDLKTAFQNFSRPRSWQKAIWELDEKNPNNNGFENEAFIVWMRYNELPVRPIWRLDRTADETYAKGLPPDNYTVNVYYQYPHSLYPGPRNLTLYREVPFEEPICEISTTTVQMPISYGGGIAAIVVGIILLLTSAGLVLAYYKVKATNENGRIQPVKHSPQNATNNSTIASNQSAEGSKTNNIAKDSVDSEEKLLSKPATSLKNTELEEKPLNDITEEEEYL
ncbi:LEM3 (ligand-effect modulator 3) family / CDC50 family domain-containing protein [Phthorimaea operculella]|nr:LEM3 (ligand-effect modulator 3) family / CDC50 family domain-containing protein [Phthorimaea operculella]